MHAVKKRNNSVVFQRTFSKYLVLGRYVGSYDSLASFSITRFKLSIFSSGEKDNTFGLVMMTLYLVLRWENIIVFCVYRVIDFLYYVRNVESTVLGDWIECS